MANRYIGRKPKVVSSFGFCDVAIEASQTFLIYYDALSSQTSSQPLPCSGCRRQCAPLRWPPGPSRPSAGASGQLCIFLGDPW